MTDRRNQGLGNLPEGLSESMTDFLGQVRRMLLDIAGGRLPIGSVQGGTGSGGGSSGSGTGGGGGGGGGGGSTTPDLTPPPTPSGVVVGAGIDFVSIKTDPPIFTQGHGYGRTIVYGAKYTGTGPLPTFSSAVRVHEFVGQVGDFSSEPATEWHIWCTWLTNDGVESVSPDGGTNGRTATTGQDVSNLLTALTGAITQSQLFSSLSTRIDLIDGSSGTAGTVNYRIATSAASLTSAFTTGDATTYANAQTYVATYAYSKSTVDGAFTSQFSALTANYAAADATVYSNAQAYVGTYAYSKATVDGAFASQTTTITAAYTAADATISAAVSTEASARATETGALFAQYTVKIDLAGFVTGYGLASTAVNGTPTSAFAVRANQFYIAPPVNFSQEATPTGTSVGQLWFKPSTTTTKTWDGSAWQPFSMPLPFIVQTTPTTINGVLIPAGVYMDAAYIYDLTASVARLGNLWVTNAMVASLSASKIVAGAVAVGEYIQSSNYVSGSAGWRIHGDGSGEFSNVTIRGATYTGTIYAGSGTIGGVTINSTNLRSTGYVADTSGFSIDNAAGSIEVNNLRVRGTLDIKSASSGARVEQTASYIKVFDASNVKRIQIGDLSA